MKILRPGLALTMFAMLSFSMVAQDHVMKLWSGGVPGSIPSEGYIEYADTGKDGIIRISKVSEPMLEVYLPPEGKATGAAVVICPGGGYRILAMAHEGWDVASWLNEHGIAGIILKYRLPSPEIMKDPAVGPLQDAQEAIRTVRRNSADWGIDPARIGILGFSAGGHLASTASTHYNKEVYDSDGSSARPDFSLLVYPVVNMDKPETHSGSRNNLLGMEPSMENKKRFSNEKQVDENTPPAFMVHSWDDKSVAPQNSIWYAEACRKHGVPVELHLYEKGGHGYGLGRGKGTQNNWPDACIVWLKNRKIIH